MILFFPHKMKLLCPYFINKTREMKLFATASDMELWKTGKPVQIILDDWMTVEAYTLAFSYFPPKDLEYPVAQWKPILWTQCYIKHQWNDFVQFLHQCWGES